MLSTVSLAERLKRAEGDPKRLLCRPRWMDDEDLSSLSAAEVIQRVLKASTNDRLPIHIGRLLYVFDKNRPEIARAPEWEHTGLPIVDLEKQPNRTYRLKAGETIVAASSEEFEVPADLAGLVLPRVRNQLSALTVSSTFIDAGWKGLINIQITNLDHRDRDLVMGREVARAFFFELSEAPPNARETAHEGAHHWGTSWASVIKDKLPPFRLTNGAPLSAALAPTAERSPHKWFDRVTDWLGIKRDAPLVVKLAYLAVSPLLIGIISVIAARWNEAVTIFKGAGQVTALATRVDALRNDVGLLKNGLYNTSTVVEIAPNSTAGVGFITVRAADMKLYSIGGHRPWVTLRTPIEAQREVQTLVWDPVLTIEANGDARLRIELELKKPAARRMSFDAVAVFF